MEINDKLPIIYENKTKICSLKKKLFVCKYFICWSLNEIDGYYKETLIFSKTKEEEKEESKYLNDWNEKLKLLKM